MNKYEQALHDEATKRGYTVLGRYVNARTKILMKCPKGHSCSISPNHFKQGKGCPKCAGLCPEQAKKNFFKLAEVRGYTVIGEYSKSSVKIAMRCDKGHSCSISPSNFKKGFGCPKCAGNCQEQAHNDFLESARSRRCTVIGEYSKHSVKVAMRCDKGHEFDQTPDGFKRGHGCPKCSGNCSEQTRDEFLTLAKRRDYTVLSEYITNKTKVSMRCDKGHSCSISPNNFKNGVGCPKCAGHCPEQSRDEFLEEAKRRGYTVLGAYVKNNVKVAMVCNKEHEFEQMPHNFKSGKGCPTCATTGYNPETTGYLYMLRGDNGLVKVGITNHLDQRLAKLRNATPFRFEVLSVFAGEGRDVINAEKAFHRNYKRAGLRGFDGATEWLHMPDFGLVDFLTSIYDLTLTTYNR